MGQICFSAISSNRACHHYRGGGGILHGNHFAGKISPPLEFPKLLKCLTHTFTCKSMPRSEAERLANQMATESSISSLLKESAVPKHLPKNYGPQACSTIGIFTALPIPIKGQIASPSLKTEFPHENIPPEFSLPL